MTSTNRLLATIVCSLTCLILSNPVQSQVFLDNGRQKGINVSRPVPGAVIVSIYQGRNEADYFAMTNEGKVVTRYQTSVSSRLQSYGIKSLWKGLHRGNIATYELTFDRVGREDEIINYLRSLPYVRYAQRDYTVEFLAEPNDFYYQPDSLAPLEHWVPDSMNAWPPPGSTGRGRDCDTLFTCCADSEIVIRTYSFLDNLHLPDNWYLQRVQANRAWDIEKGSPDVKIMIMDSGIDIDHPDLAANIWSNPDGDAEGDVSGDGVPGIKGQDVDGDGGKGFNDPDVGKSDINHNGVPLWGTDSLADCGPDGDYGFGPNGIDDPPPGPGGGDDDTLVAGLVNDPWDDNLRGPGSLNPDSSFNDDMSDVLLMKNDDNEDGYPDDFCGLNFYDPGSTLVPRENGCPNSVNSSGCHGTEMAGIVGAVTNNSIGMAGMAWNCKLVAAKIAIASPESGKSGSVIPIANALYYAIDKGVDVVNMSLGVGGGTWDQPTINDAIDSASVHGIVLVAGAGNEHTGDVYYYPASSAHVISVSACDRRDGEATCPTCPTFNDSVDVCGVISAPRSEGSSSCVQGSQSSTCYDRGADCVVTAFLPPPQPQFNSEDPGLPHGYAITGLATSGATAQVSGLAALLVSFYPRARFHEMFPDSMGDPPYARFIERELKRGCVPISGEHANKMGAGRIDAFRSLTQWGTIAENTIWNDRVYVSGDLKINSGSTLTILPGTTVYFTPEDNQDSGIDPARVVLEVRGTLIAEGTAQHPIVFKSFAENPGPEDWYGIWFKANSSGSLSHCKIENAKYGLKHDSAIDIEDCEIIWEQYSYVLRDLTIDEGLTLTIKPGTTVYVAPEDTGRTEPDTMRVALDVKGVLNANGTADHPIIFKSSSDEFLPGDWYGILYADENSSGSLSHCLIQDARYGVESAVAIQIADCEITNCMTAGIYMYDNMDSNSVVNNSSTIRRCNIHNNLYPVSAGMRIWNCPDTVLVDSCTVTGNGVGIWVSNACPKITNSTASSNHYQGVLVTSYEYPAPYPYPVIKWCHMHGNGQEGIKCQYNSAKVSYTKSWGNGTYGILAYGVDATPTIDHSKLISNSAAGLRADSYAYPILGNASLGLGQNNSLYGPNQAKNVWNATSLSIFAQNCWWGSAPPDLSKFQGQVTYQPYLTSDPVYYLAPMRPKMPSVLSLEQNFPNPFNVMKGVTTIKYSIPSERDRVVLTIYDVSGRRVCTLVDRPHQPGYYYARWDGRNDGGARVAPGMYFCRMNVGKQCFTKKMVVLR